MRIALFNTEERAYSQTFVREHIAGLPGTVIPIFGGPHNWRHAGKFLGKRPFRSINGLSDRVPPSWVRLSRRRMDDHLVSFLRQNAVDVVLVEFADAALALHEVCRQARIPLVVHCHGYDVYKKELVEQQQDEYRRLFQQAAGIVVVSHAMQQQVIQLGAPSEKVHRNPCGVHVERFEPTDAGRNPPILLAVGRFVEKKAPHLTILAFRRTLQSCPEAQLWMAGEGPLLDCCVQLVKAVSVETSVRFLGSQHHSQVAKLMQQARAFVQHSVVAPDGDSEGSPVSIMEAGASALPVVATRHGGIVESVVDGETGFLVDEFDVEGMAQQMCKLLQFPALASQMGMKGRSKITREFSSTNTAGLGAILEQAVEHEKSRHV